MGEPRCDHCDLPVRLEYRASTFTARWTHDTGPVGRWTCPRTQDGRRLVDERGVVAMATVSGVEWFDMRAARRAS